MNGDLLMRIDKLKNSTFLNDIGLELNGLNWVCSCLSLLIFVLLHKKTYFLPKFRALVIIFSKVRQFYAYCFFLLLISSVAILFCYMIDKSNSECIQRFRFNHHFGKYQGYVYDSGFLIFTSKITKLAIWLYIRGGFLLLLMAYLSQRTIFSQLTIDSSTLNTYLDHTAYQNYHGWAFCLHAMILLYFVYVFIMTFVGFFVHKHPEYISKIDRQDLKQYQVLFHSDEYYIILTAVGENDKYRLYKEYKSGENNAAYLKSRENEIFDCYEDCKNYLNSLQKKQIG